MSITNTAELVIMAKEEGHIAGLKEALAIVEGLDLSRLDEAGVHIRSRIASLVGEG